MEALTDPAWSIAGAQFILIKGMKKNKKGGEKIKDEGRGRAERTEATRQGGAWGWWEEAKVKWVYWVFKEEVWTPGAEERPEDQVGSDWNSPSLSLSLSHTQRPASPGSGWELWCSILFFMMRNYLLVNYELRCTASRRLCLLSQSSGHRLTPPLPPSSGSVLKTVLINCNYRVFQPSARSSPFLACALGAVF